MLILPIDCKLTTDVPEKECNVYVFTHLVQTQYQFLFVHIAEEMCLNLKPIFENNAL